MRAVADLRVYKVCLDFIKVFVDFCDINTTAFSTTFSVVPNFLVHGNTGRAEDYSLLIKIEANEHRTFPVLGLVASQVEAHSKISFHKPKVVVNFTYWFRLQSSS